MTESKLPRGSFFYIQVGPLFYAGKRPLTATVREHATRMIPRMQAMGIRYGFRGMGSGWQPHKPHCRPLLMGFAYGGKTEEVTIHTGSYETIMAPTLQEAKQFRRRSQAQTVLEQLVREYRDVNVVPRMGKVEGNQS